MFSTLLPTISPLSRFTSLPRINENPFSSFKHYSTAGKRTVEGPNLECFHPARPRLAAASVSAADAEINDEETAIQLPGDLQPELMPKHVAIIMDGNGRWAKRRGLPVQLGHKAGSDNLRRLIPICSDLGIKILTVYAFSTENWNRSRVEVDLLMRVFGDFIQSYVNELMERHDTRFSVIGDRSRLPKSLQSVIKSAEESSKGNKGIQLVGALSYSGRYEIVEATKKIASKVERGILRAKDVDESLFEQQLMTSLIEFPDPDLLIRTSGELRVSNFLLWQLAYTELYFSDKAFPDFGEAELIQAFVSYQQRQRRYGGRTG